MLKSRVIFTRLLFAATTGTVPTGPAVAQYGHWHHRSPFQFGRHYAQFRQEAPWRRWESAQRASHQSMKPPHREGFEAPHQPSSIGAYKPGSTPGSVYLFVYKNSGPEPKADSARETVHDCIVDTQSLVGWIYPNKAVGAALGVPVPLPNDEELPSGGLGPPAASDADKSETIPPVPPK